MLAVLSPSPPALSLAGQAVEGCSEPLQCLTRPVLSPSSGDRPGEAACSCRPCLAARRCLAVVHTLKQLFFAPTHFFTLSLSRSRCNLFPC